MPEIFRAHVQKNPSATALVFGSVSLTYRELDELSDKVAVTLEERGVSRGDVVGLLLPRSLETIVCMLAALKAGTVDALFWSGGVPTAAVAAAQQEVPLALLDLSALLPELRKRHGAQYDRVLIPEGSYPGVPAVWTVGAANLLLCRADLDAGTVERTVQLLVHHAGELIPQSSLGVQFLSPETLINTAGIPLHPAAADAYRKLHG